MIDTFEAKLRTSQRWQQMAKQSRRAAAALPILWRGMEQVGRQHPSLSYEDKVGQLKVHLTAQLIRDENEASAEPRVALQDREALRACNAE